MSKTLGLPLYDQPRIHSKRQHSGWATQAKRRGEDYLQCNSPGCGQRRHPRQQAGPIEPAPPMPVVRVLNLFLAATALWLVIIGWGLSEAHKAGVL